MNGFSFFGRKGISHQRRARCNLRRLLPKKIPIERCIHMRNWIRLFHRSPPPVVAPPIALTSSGKIIVGVCVIRNPDWRLHVWELVCAGGVRQEMPPGRKCRQAGNATLEETLRHKKPRQECHAPEPSASSDWK